MVRKTTAKEVATNAKKSSTQRNKKKATNTRDEQVLDDVKKKRKEGVKSVKNKLHEGEDMFSDELDSAKFATKSFVTNTINWIKENRQTIVGILCLVLAMYHLWQFIRGIILLIAGILLVTGYFDKDE